MTKTLSVKTKQNSKSKKHKTKRSQAHKINKHSSTIYKSISVNKMLKKIPKHNVSATIFHKYFENAKPLIDDNNFHKNNLNILTQIPSQLYNNPLIFSDHAPIVYNINKDIIIIWNIGQWGCEKYSDGLNYIYNHKINMKRRENYYEYTARLENIINVLEALLKRYPTAYFCLQEVPTFFLNSDTPNNLTLDYIIKGASSKLNSMLDKHLQNNINIILLGKLMTDVLVMFYSKLKKHFTIHKFIDTTNSNSIIIYGKQSHEIKPLELYPAIREDNKFRNYRAQGIYNIHDTIMNAYISVHFLYNNDEKNAEIITDIFKTILTKLVNDNTHSVITTNVFLCGDFNRDYTFKYIDQKQSFYENCTTSINKVLLNTDFAQFYISNIDINKTSGNSTSYGDNMQTKNDYQIDYVLKITLSIQEQKSSYKQKLHSSQDDYNSKLSLIIHKPPVVNEYIINTNNDYTFIH